MNLFNFLRFSNIEEKTSKDNAIFRLAQRRNGKFVLVDNSGKIISPECDWISKEIEGIRLYENSGILSYFMNNDGELQQSAMPRVSGKETELPEVYASAEENGVSQITISNDKTYKTFMLNQDKQTSKVFVKLTPANKNDLRLGWVQEILPNGFVKKYVEVLSKDCFESFDKFDKVFEPDQNGVRHAISRGGYPNYEEYRSLILPNFGKNIERYLEAKHFDTENYIVTLKNGKQAILNKNGKNVAGGLYNNIEFRNQIGEVIATRSKSGNGVVLIHEGKRFRKVDDLHRVIDSAPIGIKAMKYGKELNQNVVAGVNISEGIQIDEDVNRVLIALLKGKKAMPRFWKSIEENNKFDELFAGVEAYNAKLDEIAKAHPELAEEVTMKKQNLSKSLATVLKRKAGGHRAYEQTEDKRIERKRTEIKQHSENISNSENARQKIDEAVNNFGK